MLRWYIGLYVVPRTISIAARRVLVFFGNTVYPKTTPILQCLQPLTLLLPFCLSSSHRSSIAILQDLALCRHRSYSPSTQRRRLCHCSG